MSARFRLEHRLATKTLPRGLSNASCFVKPVISAVLLFHSFTLPLISIPKIGALALKLNDKKIRFAKLKRGLDLGEEPYRV